ASIGKTNRLIVPGAEKSDEIITAFSAISNQLKRIGNNVNQIAHISNATQHLTYENATRLDQEIQSVLDFQISGKISQRIDHLFNQPIDILETVKNGIEHDSELLYQIKELVESKINDSKT
ncbi:MAG: MobC family plasmid mobilization relaxosome protein, partial [Gammaproteobacteria bacterium]|nr:MobC family plasmid mobilization relaxosome protein [Gammaproteobacteria bacterium]